MERKIVYVSKFEYKIREILAQITYMIIVGLIGIGVVITFLMPIVLMYLANLTKY